MDNRGEFTPLVAVIILVISMILAVALFYAGIKIQIIGIQNTIKSELANLSVKISDVTYDALREGNFGVYKQLLNDTAYINTLTQSFYNDLESHLSLITETYGISNVKLSFSNVRNTLVYTFTCKISFRVTVLGGKFPEIERIVTIEGRHNAKY